MDEAMDAAMDMVRNGVSLNKAAVRCKVSQSSLVSEASRAARRVFSTAEVEVLAGSLQDLTKEGWELNRDSVRVVLHIYLHMIGKKKEGEGLFASDLVWPLWFGWFEKRLDLTEPVSRLPGQPTDEFLQVTTQILERRHTLKSAAQPRNEVAAGAPQEALYEVERICAKRGGSGTSPTEYLIKWRGFDPAENSWEPRAHLDCSEMLESFEARWAMLSTYQRWQLAGGVSQKECRRLLGDAGAAESPQRLPGPGGDAVVPSLPARPALKTHGKPKPPRNRAAPSKPGDSPGHRAGPNSALSSPIDAGAIARPPRLTPRPQTQLPRPPKLTPRPPAVTSQTADDSVRSNSISESPERRRPNLMVSPSKAVVSAEQPARNGPSLGDVSAKSRPILGASSAQNRLDSAGAGPARVAVVAPAVNWRGKPMMVSPVLPPAGSGAVKRRRPQIYSTSDEEESPPQPTKRPRSDHVLLLTDTMWELARQPRAELRDGGDVKPRLSDAGAAEAGGVEAGVVTDAVSEAVDAAAAAPAAEMPSRLQPDAVAAPVVAPPAPAGWDSDEAPFPGFTAGHLLDAVHVPSCTAGCGDLRTGYQVVTPAQTVQERIQEAARDLQRLWRREARRERRRRDEEERRERQEAEKRRREREMAEWRAREERERERREQELEELRARVRADLNARDLAEKAKRQQEAALQQSIEDAPPPLPPPPPEQPPSPPPPPDDDVTFTPDSPPAPSPSPPPPSDPVVQPDIPCVLKQARVVLERREMAPLAPTHAVTPVRRKKRRRGNGDCFSTIRKKRAPRPPGQQVQRRASTATVEAEQTPAEPTLPYQEENTAEESGEERREEAPSSDEEEEEEEQYQSDNGRPVIMVLPPVVQTFITGATKPRALDLETRWGTVKVQVVPKIREKDGSLRELAKTTRKKVGIAVEQDLLQTQRVDQMVKYYQSVPAFVAESPQSGQNKRHPNGPGRPPRPPPPEHGGKDHRGVSRGAYRPPSGSSPPPDEAVNGDTATADDGVTAEQSAQAGVGNDDRRLSGEARPLKQSGEARPPKQSGEGRPPRQSGEARPPRQSGEARPARKSGSLLKGSHRSGASLLKGGQRSGAGSLSILQRLQLEQKEEEAARAKEAQASIFDPGAAAAAPAPAIPNFVSLEDDLRTSSSSDSDSDSESGSPRRPSQSGPDSTSAQSGPPLQSTSGKTRPRDKCALSSDSDSEPEPEPAGGEPEPERGRWRPVPEVAALPEPVPALMQMTLSAAVVDESAAPSSAWSTSLLVTPAAETLSETDRPRPAPLAQAAASTDGGAPAAGASDTAAVAGDPGPAAAAAGVNTDAATSDAADGEASVTTEAPSGPDDAVEVDAVADSGTEASRVEAQVPQVASEAAPVMKTLAEAASVAEVAPVTETLAEMAPVAEALAEVAPIAETPAEAAPVAETPAEKVPMADTPLEEVPVAETPLEEVHVAEMPAEEVPVAETRVEEMPEAVPPAEAVPDTAYDLAENAAAAEIPVSRTLPENPAVQETRIETPLAVEGVSATKPLIEEANVEDNEVGEPTAVAASVTEPLDGEVTAAPSCELAPVSEAVVPAAAMSEAVPSPPVPALRNSLTPAAAALLSDAATAAEGSPASGADPAPEQQMQSPAEPEAEFAVKPGMQPTAAAGEEDVDSTSQSTTETLQVSFESGSGTLSTSVESESKSLPTSAEIKSGTPPVSAENETKSLQTSTELETKSLQTLVESGTEAVQASVQNESGAVGTLAESETEAVRTSVENEAVRTSVGNEAVRTSVGNEAVRTSVETEAVRTSVETEAVRTSVETEAVRTSAESETEAVRTSVENETETVRTSVETEAVRTSAESETEAVRTSVENETETVRTSVETEAVRTSAESETEAVRTSVENETEAVRTSVESETETVRTSVESETETVRTAPENSSLPRASEPLSRRSDSEAGDAARPAGQGTTEAAATVETEEPTPAAPESDSGPAAAPVPPVRSPPPLDDPLEQSLFSPSSKVNVLDSPSAEAAPPVVPPSKESAVVCLFPPASASEVTSADTESSESLSSTSEAVKQSVVKSQKSARLGPVDTFLLPDVVDNGPSVPEPTPQLTQPNAELTAAETADGDAAAPAAPPEVDVTSKPEHEDATSNPQVSVTLEPTEVSSLPAVVGVASPPLQDSVTSALLEAGVTSTDTAVSASLQDSVTSTQIAQGAPAVLGGLTPMDEVTAGVVPAAPAAAAVEPQRMVTQVTVQIGGIETTIPLVTAAQDPAGSLPLAGIQIQMPDLSNLPAEFAPQSALPYAGEAVVQTAEEAAPAEMEEFTLDSIVRDITQGEDAWADSEQPHQDQIQAPEAVQGQLMPQQYHQQQQLIESQVNALLQTEASDPETQIQLQIPDPEAQIQLQIPDPETQIQLQMSDPEAQIQLHMSGPEEQMQQQVASAESQIQHQLQLHNHDLLEAPSVRLQPLALSRVTSQPAVTSHVASPARDIASAQSRRLAVTRPQQQQQQRSPALGRRTFTVVRPSVAAPVTPSQRAVTSTAAVADGLRPNQTTLPRIVTVRSNGGNTTQKLISLNTSSSKTMPKIVTLKPSTPASAVRRVAVNQSTPGRTARVLAAGPSPTAGGPRTITIIRPPAAGQRPQAQTQPQQKKLTFVRLEPAAASAVVPEPAGARGGRRPAGSRLKVAVSPFRVGLNTPTTQQPRQTALPQARIVPSRAAPVVVRRPLRTSAGERRPREVTVARPRSDSTDLDLLAQICAGESRQTAAAAARVSGVANGPAISLPSSRSGQKHSFPTVATIATPPPDPAARSLETAAVTSEAPVTSEDGQLRFVLADGTSVVADLSDLDSLDDEVMETDAL